MVLNDSIEDAAAFAAHQAEARDYVMSGVWDFLVYEPCTEILEGENSGHQTVVFRFPSAEKARSFYHSKE